ncbi:hypothetical protein L209DRAFT_757983 [Thermothelomyces heterothallicus CBS 203.75]
MLYCSISKGLGTRQLRGAQLQLESVEREPAFLFGYVREPEEGENATIIAASTSSHFGPFDTKSSGVSEDDEG